MASNTPSHDDNGDALGLVAGSGIVLVQAAAVIPGLLPVLLLLLPLALPLVVLGIAGGVLVGLPLGLWRLGAWVVGSLRRLEPHGLTGTTSAASWSDGGR